MKRFVAFLFLLLPILPTPIHAGELPPLPPDPAAIFAPDVEVLNVAINLPPVVDNDARTIQVLNEQTRSWQTFNYPSEIKWVNNAYLENGRVTLVVNEDIQKILYIWIFDPATAEFHRYENACINWKQHSENGFGGISMNPHWEFYTDEKLGRTSLCYTGTEKQEYLLPKGGYWSVNDETPDGKWLILWNTDESYLSRVSDVHVYSYNLAAKQLLYLGDFPLGEGYPPGDVSSLRWISDTQGAYYSGDMPESSPRSWFYFDLTKPNSLIYLMDGWAAYYDDPPRFEYLQTFYEVTHRLDVYGNYPECEVQLYYFSQEEPKPHTYHLGRDCFGNVLRNQTRYFYVGYGEQEPTTLTLYSLDTETEERQAWFSDKELLGLNSISPDGRYAILMLNDGNWPPIHYNTNYPMSDDSRPLEELDPFYSDSRLRSSHIAIYDTSEKRVVYESSSWEYYKGIEWVDDRSFLASDGESGHPVQQFHLTENGLEQSDAILPDKSIWNFSPDGQIAIKQLDSQFLLYNVSTGKTRLLMAELQSDSYQIGNIEWLDNTQLKISLFRINRASYEQPVATYTIRIPQFKSDGQ